MTFFDWFMALIGIANMITLIFWIVCRVKPVILRNDKVRFLYNFIEGDDYANILYETE